MAKRSVAQTIVVLLVVLSASAAVAQRRYVVADLAGDDGRRYTEALTDAVFQMSDFDVVDALDLYDEINFRGWTEQEFFDNSAYVSETASAVGLEAIVTGELDSPRNPREIVAVVYEGLSGQETQRFFLPLYDDQVDVNDPAFSQLIEHMESIMAAAERGEPLMAERAPERTPPTREPRDPGNGGRANGGSSSSGSGLGLSARDEEPDARWLRVQAGLDVIQRSFKLADAQNNGIQYESGFRPGLEVMLQIFPVAAFAPGTADGLGISIRVARYFIDTQLQDDTQILTIPTRHKELGFTLSYAHPFGPLEVMAAVGYESSNFILGDNPVYSSSSYSGFAVGLGLRYHIVEDFLSVGVNGEFRPSPTLGDEEQAAFGAGSGSGLGVSAEARFLFFDHVELAGGYALRRFSADFDGSGTNPLEAVTATDTYNHLGVRLSYVH